MLHNHKKPVQSNSIISEIVTMTPDIAAQWLEQNTGNRKISQQTVDRYKNDMMNGLWQLTGDAIRFDTKQRLIDGQHRLLACVAAKVPFQTVVIYNLPPSTQDVIDGGKPRKAADALSLHGFGNTTALAAAAKRIITAKRGTTIGKQPISSADVLACLDRHPKLHLYVAHPGHYPRGISAANIGAICYIGSELLGRHDTALAFAQVMKTGVPSFADDPAHTYRERIIGQSVGPKMFTDQTKWWTLKHVWNLFNAGTPAPRIRFATTNVDIVGVKHKQY